MTSLSFLDLKFHSEFVSSLPADPETRNVTRAVSNACFSFVEPTVVSHPNLLGWSSHFADELGLSRVVEKDNDLIAAILSGNKILDGMRPYAARYGGHQFGHWAGQLGDGRAITLGEFFDSNSNSWELQLKGAGPTPYSRRADGRAVLRSSVREFLCSEFMHALGIPTTRALSLVSTGDGVMRDMFYDGNPGEEPGAIVSRLAPSFLRFGNFQILSDQNEIALLKQLSDFAISKFFPEYSHHSKPNYGAWFEDVCRRTAHLISEWQRVGFVHGVMNTDNMSILGLTIDYGPYGWLEGYDPMWTPNTTDAQGRRYCYGRQPQIGHWNLQRFGEALLPLFGESKSREIFEAGLQTYSETFVKKYRQTLADKFGIQSLNDRRDYELAQDFLDLLEVTETDMTIMFRHLATVSLTPIEWSWNHLQPIYDAFFKIDEITPALKQSYLDWFRRYADRIQKDTWNLDERVQRMNQVNPNFVLRNYLCQEVIDDLMVGSTKKIHTIQSATVRPYAHDVAPELIQKRPEWARNRPGCSALSCSS